MQCAGTRASRIFGRIVIGTKLPLLEVTGELNIEERFTRRCLSSGSVLNAVRVGCEHAKTHVQKQEPYHGKMPAQMLSQAKHSSQS